MKKLVALILALCAALSAFGCLAAAGSDDTAAYLARSADKDGVESLASSLGCGEEWTVFALARMGADFSGYERSFDSSREKLINPVERERCALALAICGADKAKIAGLVQEAIGGQGIMSLVFGLHVISNGVEYAGKTCEEIIDSIISMQLPDGGFALFGSVSDVDVSAMTLQSLAPFLQYENARVASEKVITFLSAAQKADGSYVSFGTESSESVSQVIIALSSVGIDCEKDERFIKNGVTLFGALARYEVGDGSYRHLRDGDANHIATVQALCAMESYKILGEPFWVFENKNPGSEVPQTSEETPETSEESSAICEESAPAEISEAISVSAAEESKTESSAPAEEESSFYGENSLPPEQKSGGSIKLIILCVLGAAAAASVCVLIIKRKANIINICVIVAVFAVACGAVALSRIESAGEYYGKTESKAQRSGTATISVSAGGIEGKDVIIARSEFDFEEDDTVYDLLVDAARANGIALDVTGTGSFIYVRAIDMIYERAHGELSGWVYTVNGVSASVGCAAYALRDGDVIEWFYTTDGIDRTAQ